MATEEYSIRVSVDSTDATRAERNLSNLSRETNRTERNLNSLSSTARASSAALSGLAGVLGGLSAAQFSKSIFEVNKEMQSLRVSLETVTGSAKNAQIAFDGIQQFASKTPYSVKEITEAFIKMKALGLSPTEAALTSFGNTASAMGKSLKQMIEAVADASTGEMERLKEFGIKASKDGDNFKMTFKGVTTVVKDNSSEIIKYLEKIGNTDFAGGMERQGKTMAGTLSSLSDSWDAFQDHILNGAAENSIAQWIGNATNLLSRFDAWINGAFIKQGKLIELRNAQASALEKITASEKNGFGGRVADAIGEAAWGYSVEKEKQKLAVIGKQMEDIKKEMAADIIAAKKITEAAPEQKKTEDNKKAKKELSAAQKELNRQQEDYQRLIESTPYGEYNAEIDRLTKALKNGGISQSTYSSLLDEANSRLLDSTEYVKEHTKALEEQKRALEGTARGTFEKGYSELITQKPYMSDTEYSAKQDKLTADYLTQQQGKDYKTPAEQAKDATSAYDDLNKKLQETATAFDSVGNSSKMAFDGLLGGVSAVAGAMSSFSGEMAQLNDNFQKGSSAYSDFMLKEGTTFEQREKATADYYSMKDKYDSASFKAEISGARQIAGATSKLFGEKSAARKAFHGVEMALSVVEMAMSAKKMIVDVAAGAARMFSQGGFAGFAGVAAMAAVMGGLGFAMMGGGDKVTDLTTPETSTTGSVLGSNEASNSIKNIVDTLNSIHASEYVELQDLNANFKDLVQQTTKGTALALQERGAFAWSTNAMKGGNTGASEKQFMMGLGTTAISAGLAAAGTGVGLATSVLAGAINASVALTGAASTVTSALVGTSAAFMSGGLAAAAAMGGIGLLVGGAIYGLSKLLGIGKVKYEAVGGGIVMNAQKFMLDGMQQQVTVFDYSKVKKTVTGWFSDDVTYFDVINRIDNPLTKLFTGIFANVELTLLEASANVFKDSDLLNTDIMLPKIKLALKSGEKYKEENQKKIEDAINKASDDIASQAFGRYLGQFQGMGEGLYETTIRLAAQAAVATAGMEKLGIKTNLTGLGLITFSDSLTRAFGGLKEFKAGIDSLYDAFTSDPQKLIDSKKQVADFLVNLNAPANAGLPTEITSKSDAAKVTDYLLNAAKNISAVTAPFLKTTNLQPDTTGMQKLWNKVAGFESMPKANAKYIKSIPVENLTTEVLLKALDGTKYTLESLKVTKPLIEYAKSNANYLDSKKQLNELKTDQVLNEELKKLTFKMPQTVAQAATLAEKLKVLEKNAGDNVAKFEGLSKATLNVITSLEKLSDAGKFITDFSKSISAWIKNIRATSMGSPETQLNMAKANFEEQLKLAKFGATAEEKRAAMSGITGYADTYMNAIKSYYATSEQGQKALEGIISQVGDLGQTVDVQELQLGALNDIKDGIYEIPKGISDANKILFNDLVTQMKTAGDVAKLNPTVENQLRYDALAKIVLMIDKSAKSGADATFIDKLIQSVAGEKGLTSNVNLVINSAEFDAAQKTTIIGNVLASFNEKRLVLNNFEFDVKDAIDAAKTSVMAAWGTPVLDINTSEVVRKLDETTSKANAAVAALGAVTTANQQAAESANAAATAAASQAAESAKAASALMTLSQAQMDALSKTPAQFQSAESAKYWQQQSNLDLINTVMLPKFANGGIANQPSMFGEAGAEAAVPLPDGRSIPVTLYNASNDSGVNSAETIAELKSQNQKLEILVNTMMATSKAEREKTQELIDAMNGLRTDTRLKAKG